MKKKIVIGIIITAVLLIVLCAFSKKPIVSCDIEIPKSYREAVEEQAKGLYSKRLPLVPIYVRIDSYTEEKLYYTIHYFPFGSVGMSYMEGDGYNIEKQLSCIS